MKRGIYVYNKWLSMHVESCGVIVCSRIDLLPLVEVDELARRPQSVVVSAFWPRKQAEYGIYLAVMWVR